MRRTFSGKAAGPAAKLKTRGGSDLTVVEAHPMETGLVEGGRFGLRMRKEFVGAAIIVESLTFLFCFSEGVSEKK